MPLLKTNIILFIFLAAATVVSHTFVDRYEQDGPELLANNWNTKVSENSQVDISENKLALFSSDLQLVVSAHQDLSLVKHGTILKLSADVKCDNVVMGEKPWNQARLILLQNDGEKDRWDLPHVAASLTGTTGWENHHSFFTIDPETQRIQVIAQLNQSTGSFQIKNIRLHPVSEIQLFTWVREIILFSWGAFFLLLVGSCFFVSRKTVILRVLLIFTFVSIIIGTTIPGGIKNQVSNEVKTQIDAESLTFKTVIPWDLSKVWHYCFFFLFGLVICLMMAKEPSIQVTAIILLLAAGTEIAQLYIDGRSPLFTDFFIDTAGGLSGVALIRLIGININTDHSKSEAFFNIK